MISESSQNVTAGYHPADPDAARDPHTALAELRRECPVARLAGDGLPPVVLVTRHEDARAVYRDYRTFGNIGFYPSLDVYAMTPPPDRTIIDLDPPEHTRVRRLNLLAMKPTAIDAVLPSVAAIAGRYVGAMVSVGAGDVVAGLAVPLPADAIAAVLGLPVKDAPVIHDWIESVFSEPAQDRPDRDASGHLDLAAAFDTYLDDQIAARRNGTVTGDDAMRRMVEFRDDEGKSFTDHELRIHIRTLLMAGNETTTSLISNMVYRMLTTPTAQQRLREDRSLIEPFIEECLRFDPPLTQFPRRCLVGATVGGLDVASDEVISISLQSVNRDETTWGGDAETFRIDRFASKQPDHLAFGLGAHFCVGAYLARHTARITMETLLDATNDIRLADDYQFDNVWFFEFWRPKRLDVVLEQ